jgi:hypothetical protein
MGAVVKSYMRKGFLIYEEMRKYLTINEKTICHIGMTLQPIHSEFPYIRGKFSFLFYPCTCIQLLSCPYSEDSFNQYEGRQADLCCMDSLDGDLF